MYRGLLDRFCTLASNAGADVRRYKGTGGLSEVISSVLSECEGGSLRYQMTEMIKSVIDGLRDRMSSLTELTDETDVTNLPEYRRDNLIYVVESSYAVADTGSVIVVASPRERLSIATATDLIVVLHEYEVFDDLLEASELLRSLASEGKVINLITGPSSTTDIESIVVVGAHGPPRLVIAINDEVKGGGS